MLLGKAIGKGLEHLVGPQPESAVNQALDALRAGFEENDIWTLEALESITTQMIKLAAKTTYAEILQNEVVVGAEVDLGGGIIDLLTKQGDLWIITDHKTKLQMKADWVQKELIEAETDWQLFDYAWRVRNHYQTNNIAIRRHLGIVSPKSKWFLHQRRLNAETIERWADGANLVWEEIEAVKNGRDPAMRLLECMGRFGKCPMYEACHTYNQDPKMMEALYEQK
jgi:PD-(D/E)XK nuclease superfamily protein